MNKKICMILLGIFLISLVSALDCWAIAEQNTAIQLIQKCPSCEAGVNITSISYPNGTVFLNEVMERNGINFNYTLPDSSQIGIVSYGVIGDKNGISPPQEETLCIEITKIGMGLSVAQAIIYLISFTFLIFIFGLLMWALFQIPIDTRDDEGFVVNVSKLEYLRPIVKGLAWIVLTGIVFIISNITIAYLSTGLMGSFLFLIFQLMMWSNLVILPLMIIRMIQRITLSKDMLGLIERGVKFN